MAVTLGWSIRRPVAGESDAGGGLGERRVTKHDIRQPRLPFEPEELVDARPPQVEIDQHNSLPRASGDDRQVRDRGGLALAFERARDHDRARVVVEAGELEVGPQHPERFGSDARRLPEEHELFRSLKLARGLGNAGEEGEAQPTGHVFGCPYTCVERIAEKREADAEDEAEREPDDAV